MENQKKKMVFVYLCFESFNIRFKCLYEAGDRKKCEFSFVLTFFSFSSYFDLYRFVPNKWENEN